MKGNEVGIFTKAPGWILLFLLMVKLKQNPGYPNKEYYTIFKHIYQNIRACPRSKKTFIDINLQYYIKEKKKKRNKKKEIKKSGQH